MLTASFVAALCAAGTKVRTGKRSAEQRALDHDNSTSSLTTVFLRFPAVPSFPGESDAGSPALYACEQRALIRDLRAKYDNARLSFHWVLLSGYQPHTTGSWPDLRAAQLASLALPYTGYASAVDLGDHLSPYGYSGVHPRWKKEVGQRMAASLAAVNYGAAVQWKGPQPADIVWPLPGSGVVVVRYDSADGANAGLFLNDTRQCDDCCTRGSAFALLTSDGRLRPAASTTVNAAAFVVVVQAPLPSGVSVVGVDHNYEMYPQCTLYNGEGWPQAPFHTMRYAQSTHE